VRERWGDKDLREAGLKGDGEKRSGGERGENGEAMGVGPIGTGEGRDSDARGGGVRDRGEGSGL